MGNEAAQTFADLAAEYGEEPSTVKMSASSGQDVPRGHDGLADLAFIMLSHTCLDPLRRPNTASIEQRSGFRMNGSPLS